jgi:hypothetical protein
MDDVYLAEFTKLKDEQINRAAHRDRLFHLTIILIGGGITIAFSREDRSTTGILLLIPSVAFVAGMSHIACDRRISEIGAYFRERLGPKIAEQRTDVRPPVFEWEDYIRRQANTRAWRKALQLLANGLLYVVSGLWAMGWYAFAVKTFATLTFWEWCTLAFDLVLMVFVAAELFKHSGLKLRSPGPRRQSSIIMATLAVSAVLGVSTGLALATYGAGLLPQPNYVHALIWHGSVIGRITSLNLTALCLALVAAYAGSMLVKRS